MRRPLRRPLGSLRRDALDRDGLRARRGVACLYGLYLARGRGRFVATALVAAAVAASHGLLDAMTDGGRGVALLWPLSTRRIFLPWRPIPVAPIGVGFLSWEGLAVAGWELVVFLPLFAYALWPRPRAR